MTLRETDLSLFIDEGIALDAIHFFNQGFFTILGFRCRCDSLEAAIEHQISIHSMSLGEMRSLRRIVNDNLDLVTRTP